MISKKSYQKSPESVGGGMMIGTGMDLTALFWSSPPDGANFRAVEGTAIKFDWIKNLTFTTFWPTNSPDFSTYRRSQYHRSTSLHEYVVKLFSNPIDFIQQIADALQKVCN